LLVLGYQCSVEDTAPVSAADGGQLPGVTGGVHAHGLVIMTDRAHGRDGAAYSAETIGALGCRASAARTGGRRIGGTETTKTSSADDCAPFPAQRPARPRRGRPGPDMIVIGASHAHAQLTPAVLGVS
jgi:hypothetical protein